MSPFSDESNRPEADLAADASSGRDERVDADTTSEVASLQAELAEAQDRLLRAQAEMENYRRRAQREMADERRFASQSLLTDLLPVIDNMERAIEAAQAGEGSGLLEGFKMVHQLLLSILQRNHCTTIPALGQPFDPSMHEAVQQAPSNEVEKGSVLMVLQQGYQLHQRVIRPAQVIVSTGPAPTSEN